MSKFLLWTTGILILMLTCVAVPTAYVALKAEERLIAVARTTEQTEAYLKKNGRWPESWESIIPDVRERNRIQQFVEFDFSATVSEVARASPNHFPFIRPIGQCSKSYELQISRLIDTAKTVQESVPAN